MSKKLSRRASLKLASSAAALSVGLGVDLSAREASAAPGSALQFKVEIEGVTVAMLSLDEKAMELIRKHGASKLAFRAYGTAGERAASLGAFRLPAAVQIKMENFLKRG
ncbi:MAG TPA: hypothetical protein PKD61_07480 [Polyangiaceae bacterium]|nr:hypothetical protein [Polyangiaceae bacterium]